MKTRKPVKTIWILLSLLAATLSYAGFKGADRFGKVNNDPPPAEAELFEVQFDKELDILQKITDRYNAHLYIRGTITYQEKKEGGQPVVEKVDFFSHSSELVNVHFMDSMLRIHEGARLLTIDHKDQSVVMMELAAPQDMNAEGFLPIAELSKYVKNITVKTNGALHTLEIELNENAPGSFPRCKLLYDPGSYRLKKMTCYGYDVEMAEGESNTASEVVVVDSLEGEIETGYFASATPVTVEVEYLEERSRAPETWRIENFVRKTERGYEPIGKIKTYSIYQ